MRLETGLFVSAPDYIRAQQARVLFNRQCHELFDTVDLLVGPTTPITATKIGVSDVKVGETTLGVIALHTQYTSAFNLNGLPAVTLPCGFTDGLPVGLQIVGRAFEEGTVLRAAGAYEKATDWHLRRPSL
jgi:aspartyl-tRNA(Asn)/glutamyl-tRNA(Gln) amidotransferase subunit A